MSVACRAEHVKQTVWHLPGLICLGRVVTTPRGPLALLRARSAQVACFKEQWIMHLGRLKAARVDVPLQRVGLVRRHVRRRRRPHVVLPHLHTQEQACLTIGSRDKIIMEASPQDDDEQP